MLSRKTLDQILEVLKGAKMGHATGQPLLKAYQKSVHDVANLYHTSYQTIADGCRRRLNLSDRDEFLMLVDRWLRGDSKGLAKLLKINVSEFEHHKIDNFFDEYSQGFEFRPINTSLSLLDQQTEAVSFRIVKGKLDQMQILAQLSGKSIPEWLAEKVGSIVESEYVNQFKKILENMDKNGRREILGILKHEALDSNDDASGTEADLLFTSKNKASGKRFIFIENTKGNKALYVTPESKIKNLSCELFEAPNDSVASELLLRGLITDLQVKKYSEFMKIPEKRHLPDITEPCPPPTDRITEDDLIPYILEVLRQHGGIARKVEVEEEIYKKLQPVFKQPWYQQRVSNGQVPRWKHNLAWAKERAKKRGLIKPPSESGRGYWALTGPQK